MEMRETVYLDCELTQWGQILDRPLRVTVQENLTNRYCLGALLIASLFLLFDAHLS